MAGTPKSVLGQVQKDPMQGYKGLSTLSQGWNSNISDATDHTHSEFRKSQQRMNVPQTPGLLANPSMAPKYPDIAFQNTVPQNSFNQEGLLGNISGWSGGVQQPELPGFPGYENLPSDWADKGYSWADPNNPDLKYHIIS